MDRRAVLTGLLNVALVQVVAPSARATQDLPSVHVWQRQSCGCCNAWAEHLRAAGFIVSMTDLPDLSGVKAMHRVPKDLQSCHTANVNDYFLEGHVPAEDVMRLLRTAPEILGLAVPGMPVGSPGMEVPSGVVEAYDVIAVGRDGTRFVFSEHGRS